MKKLKSKNVQFDLLYNFRKDEYNTRRYFKSNI